MPGPLEVEELLDAVAALTAGAQAVELLVPGHRRTEPGVLVDAEVDHRRRCRLGPAQPTGVILRRHGAAGPGTRALTGQIARPVTDEQAAALSCRASGGHLAASRAQGTPRVDSSRSGRCGCEAGASLAMGMTGMMSLLRAKRYLCWPSWPASWTKYRMRGSG